jgi:hypothetical protein
MDNKNITLHFTLSYCEFNQIISCLLDYKLDLISLKKGDIDDNDAAAIDLQILDVDDCLASLAKLDFS